MTNSHGVGKQTEFNILIPRAINTVTLCKTTSLTPNWEPEHKSRIAPVGSSESTPSCPGGGGRYPPIQLTEARECRRSTDEIPVSRRSQEKRGGEAANSPGRGDQEASKYPPGAERVSASERAPAHFLYRSPGSQEGTISGGWSRQHERVKHQHTPSQPSSVAGEPIDVSEREA